MRTARNHRRGGYSLIELLVVIAIIAIIAAILFPVFAAVREKGRQTTVMSNFEKIQRGLGQFQLDEHHYPPALYGYYAAGQSMDAHPTGHGAATGLFPQFIGDASVFVDPNNPDKDDLTTPVSVPVGQLNGAALAPISRQFYKADSFDISPKITDANTLDTTTYLPRYQTSWTDIVAGGGANGKDYQRQLRWPNPAGDTFVTCTTYHVPKGAVLALWLSGSAKTVDSRRYLQETGGTDANYWKITPSGN